MRLRGRYPGLVPAGWLRVSFSMATSALRDLISFSSTLKRLISFRIGFSFALFFGLFGCSTSGVSKTFTHACLPNLRFRSASLFAARFNFSNKTSSDTLISFKYGSMSALILQLIKPVEMARRNSF